MHGARHELHEVLTQVVELTSISQVQVWIPFWIPFCDDGTDAE
jgi:hypothetical protein